MGPWTGRCVSPCGPSFFLHKAVVTGCLSLHPIPPPTTVALCPSAPPCRPRSPGHPPLLVPKRGLISPLSLAGDPSHPGALKASSSSDPYQPLHSPRHLPFPAFGVPQPYHAQGPKPSHAPQGAKHPPPLPPGPTDSSTSQVGSLDRKFAECPPYYEQSSVGGCRIPW